MKKLWLLVLVVLLPVQAFAARSTGVTDSKTWITVDSITWTMDATYTVGQYVNLDYYVVCPSGCAVTAISPTPTSTYGTVKNPTVGMDNGIFLSSSNPGLYPNYVSALNVGLSLPIFLVNNDIIISTTPHAWDIEDQTVIEEAAVLSIVSSAPSANSFRPGIANRSVAGWTESNINYDVFADLTAVTGQPSMATVADNFARLWLDFNTAVVSNRIVRPHANQQDYAADATSEIGEGAMMLNMNYTNPEKRSLAIGMIQLGIDTYSLQTQGREWGADGGHAGGRKVLIMIAGAALNSSAMLNIGLKSGEYGIGTFSSTPADYINFGEDDQINYITQAHVDCSNNVGCWNPESNDYGNPEAPYTSAMIGMPEYGKRMIYEPEWSESSWTSSYRQLNNPTYTGQVLAMLAMGLRDEWNNDALFDYVDRYMAISRGNADPCGYTVPNERTDWMPNAFIVNAYDTHRATYGDLCQGSAGPPPPTPTAKIRYRLGGSVITQATEN